MNLIESIKTHLRKFTMLCVSLTRPQHKTELQENEKIDKFEKNNKMCFIEKYQYLITSVGVIFTIIGVLMTTPVLIFTILDRNSSIQTKVFINELPKIQNTLTSIDLTFEIKQKNNVMVYIEKPKVFIRVLYYNLKNDDIEVTNQLTNINNIEYFVLEKNGQIIEIKYNFSDSLIQYVKRKTNNKKILAVKIYLTYYDKSSHKSKSTEKSLITDIYNNYLMNKSLDTAKMLKILQTIENPRQK